MATEVLPATKSAFASGLVDWTTADLRVMLLRSTSIYSSSIDFENDIASEVTVSGYSQVALTSESIETSGTTRRLKAGSPIVFPGPFLAEAIVKTVVIKIHVGSDKSLNRIISWHDLVEQKTVAIGQGFQFTVPTDGFILIP